MVPTTRVGNAGPIHRGSDPDAKLKAATPQNPSPQSKTWRPFEPVPCAPAPWTAVTKPAQSPLWLVLSKSLLAPKASWTFYLLTWLALQSGVPGLLFASTAYFQRAACPLAESCSTPIPAEPPASPRPFPAPPADSGSDERGPVPGLQLYAIEKNGAVWLGSRQGAARFDPMATDPWERWQYFFGRRWLRDNEVRNIWLVESKESIQTWIRTATGVSLIEARRMTLAGKAEYFEDRIEKRHVRFGLVANSNLTAPGDLRQNVKRDNDNDGLWTAIYLGAQAYRYAVTRDPEARARAQRSLAALMRLEQITGVPGFYARSFVAAEDPRPVGGEWHPTSDGRWLWKGDTSSDESVGHYYAYGIYFDLVADRQEKNAIAALVSRMTDYLIEHDYELLDLDGQPTRWGRWSEKYFATEEGSYESALRSLELLSFLKTAWHVTGNKKYREAYEDRIRRGYARRMRDYRRWAGGGEINFSDDELAYLSYDPLLRYEKDPALKSIYLESLRYTWERIKSDKNPLWNFMSMARGAAPRGGTTLRQSVLSLQRIPMDLVDWKMQNSHRLDVRFQPNRDRFGQRQLTEALAPDERPVRKWNSNPYIPDGGDDGLGEDDGGFFLLPYWLGRYYGWTR